MATDSRLLKEEYKAKCEDLLAKKRKEIEKLNKKLAQLVPGTGEYKQCQIDLDKAEKKATEYTQSIYIMDVQLNLKTHPRFVGLPIIVTISGR